MKQRTWVIERCAGGHRVTTENVFSTRSHDKLILINERISALKYDVLKRIIYGRHGAALGRDKRYNVSRTLRKVTSFYFADFSADIVEMR